jgi:hypothetical protein
MMLVVFINMMTLLIAQYLDSCRVGRAIAKPTKLRLNLTKINRERRSIHQQQGILKCNLLM